MTVKIYLVEDCKNSPGTVYAIFHEEESALDFRDRYHSDNANVVPRTLLYGQHSAMSDINAYIE